MQIRHRLRLDIWWLCTVWIRDIKTVYWLLWGLERTV